jgi:hypothetical protein
VPSLDGTHPTTAPYFQQGKLTTIVRLRSPPAISYVHGGTAERNMQNGAPKRLQSSLRMRTAGMRQGGDDRL